MKTWELVIIDPPWWYTSFGTARLPYKPMKEKRIKALRVGSVLARPRSMLLVWVTSPHLFGQQARVIRHWCRRDNLHFRGVIFVWIKTTKDGRVIGAQGPRATTTNPMAEYVAVLSPRKTGRPLPLVCERQGQVILAPRGRHSEKPLETFHRLDRMYPQASRLEIFARGRDKPGWDSWGDEAFNPVALPGFYGK